MKGEQNSWRRRIGSYRIFMKFYFKNELSMYLKLNAEPQILIDCMKFY